MKKKNVLISVIALLALAAIATAAVPPPPVNQNIGVYDTSVNQFNQTLCRGCHTTTGTITSGGYTNTTVGGVPTRHHNKLTNNQINPNTNAPFGCSDCHPVVTTPNGQSVLLDRNCIDCHNGTAFYANPTAINFKRPHHGDTSRDTLNIGQPAQDRNCKFCHGSFVDNYNDGHYIPPYAESIITPSPIDKVFNATSGRHWGGCLACHQQNLNAVPNIMGPVANIGLGILNDDNNTHHLELAGVTPGFDCAWCHRNIPPPNGSNSFIDIRACEDCHSVATIHNIQYNYNATQGQLGYGHIGANWDCNGCHAFWDAGNANPFVGAIIPDISNIKPSVMKAGQPNRVTIEGTNFVQKNYATKVVVDGITYTPTSITDAQLVVSIPALKPGSHTIKVAKGDSSSRLASVTAVSNPTITSAYLRAGVLTINGAGFGTKPTQNAQQYVIITHGEKISYSQAIISWNNYQIRAKADSTIARAGDTVTVITATGEASAKVR